jgi:hypothetical protein
MSQETVTSLQGILPDSAKLRTAACNSVQHGCDKPMPDKLTSTI